jgi:GNAT superfamily N-acetyltransferase
MLAPGVAAVEIRAADPSMRGALAECLAAIEARDPLALPVEPEVLYGGVAAVDAAGRVLGAGWLRATDEGTCVEVRVRPGHRKQGLGAALFDRLATGQGTLVATCDAGHRSVRRFLEHRGFELLGVVFHQRWDGEPADVPPAFRTCVLRDEPDGERACAWLHEFAPGAWPRPSVAPEDLATDPGAFARVAWADGQPAGVVLGHRDDDALAIDGLSVSPERRGRGVGRALLCDVMRRAAAEGLGVTLHVSHLDEDTLEWTSSLGFWTFRPWAWYRRG